MRIAFVDNLLVSRQGSSIRMDLQPHLGLLSLISVAQGSGHECRLIDPKLELHTGRLSLDATLYNRLARTILDAQPDVIGLTSLGCNFVCTVKVARCIKREVPHIPILLGGPHATILDQEILQRFSEFDVAVRGEGELSLAPLLEALETDALATVPGITYRSGEAILRTPRSPIVENLDDLPPADYSHYPIEQLGLTNLRIEAGRGCPFECTFCSTASFFGRRYRLKSATRLVQEMENLRTRYGVSSFSLTHDLFTVNKAKVRAFCETVKDRNFEWSCSARTDCVDLELLAQMRAAGCRSVYYGIETGSQRMQRVARKKLDLAASKPILAATQSLGIATTISFITGYPDETENDQNETLDYISDCYRYDSALLNIQLHLLTPEPGTELMRANRERLLYDGHISDFNFPALEEDDDDLMRGNPDIFPNHHFFPTEIPRKRNVFITDLLPALHALGFPILERVLARHGGKLSNFMCVLIQWQEEHESLPGPYELLPRYFEEVFGPSDVMTAIMRYATVGACLLATTYRTPKSENVSLSSADRFRMSPAAILLRDLPNVPAIIDALGRAREMEPQTVLSGIFDQRDDWIISVDAQAKRSLRNYRLHPLAAELVSFVTAPRSLQDCFRRFSDVLSTDEIESFLTQLDQDGLLEPVANPPPEVADIAIRRENAEQDLPEPR